MPARGDCDQELLGAVAACCDRGTRVRMESRDTGWWSRRAERASVLDDTVTPPSPLWSHPPADSLMCCLGRCSFIILLLATERIPTDIPWNPHLRCSQRLEQVTP